MNKGNMVNAKVDTKAPSLVHVVHGNSREQSKQRVDSVQVQSKETI
jgi:hypothetical protein